MLTVHPRQIRFGAYSCFSTFGFVLFSIGMNMFLLKLSTFLYGSRRRQRRKRVADQLQWECSTTEKRGWDFGWFERSAIINYVRINRILLP